MTVALSPATLEGWYALHQVLTVDWPGLRALGGPGRERVARELDGLLEEWASPEGGGWSAAFQLVGGGADLLLVHFRADLDRLAAVETRLRQARTGDYLRPVYDYLSVTEAGLYHATAEAAAEFAPGSPEYQRAIEERAAAEAATPHIQTRLYPRVPEGMRFMSFYPMSKRRANPDNWYLLPVEERSRLMRDHGLTGRRFAGRVFQVITGSVGLDDWEWGVTLFARDPLEFKRIVTDMRFDEVSARYGEFGQFFTGVKVEPGAWSTLLGAS